MRGLGGWWGGRRERESTARRHQPALPSSLPTHHPDLGSSGAAAIEWPAGNLRALTDFAAALKDPAAGGEGAIVSLAAATGQMLDGLCTPEFFTPQSFVPAGCSSPEVELRLVPAECLLEAASGAMTCRPAYLLLETRAAVCTGPYYAAAQWVGRSCAPYALVGPKVSFVVVVGGEEGREAQRFFGFASCFFFPSLTLPHTHPPTPTDRLGHRLQ